MDTDDEECSTEDDDDCFGESDHGSDGENDFDSDEVVRADEGQASSVWAPSEVRPFELKGGSEDADEDEGIEEVLRAMSAWRPSQLCASRLSSSTHSTLRPATFE